MIVGRAIYEGTLDLKMRMKCLKKLWELLMSLSKRVIPCLDAITAE